MSSFPYLAKPKKISSWLGVLLMGCLVTFQATASCKWQVSGTLIGVGSTVEPSQFNTWPITNRSVRVQARWANTNIWNSVNWPTTTTDESGSFTVTSNTFVGADCYKTRYIRIQLQSSIPLNDDWYTHYTELFEPPSTSIDDTYVTEFYQLDCITGHCIPGEVELLNVFPPASVLGDGNNDDQALENGELSTPPDIQGPSNAANELDQCRNYRLDPAIQRDLRLIAVSDPVGVLNANKNLAVSARALNGTAILNRLLIEFELEYVSTAEFSHNADCAVSLAVRSYEGHGIRANVNERTDDQYYSGWGIWERRIRSLEPGESKKWAIGINLYGTDQVPAGDWESQFEGQDAEDFYEYVLLEVKLDFNNRLIESNETNNSIRACYHAAEQVFVELSQCDIPEEL